MKAKLELESPKIKSFVISSKEATLMKIRGGACAGAHVFGTDVSTACSECCN